MSFNVQNAVALEIEEGVVKTIHDKNNVQLWGAVGYDVKYKGDTSQTTYTGKNLFGGLTFASKTYVTSWSLQDNILTVTPSDGSRNPTLVFSLDKAIPAGTYTLYSQTKISSSTQLRENAGSLGGGANFGGDYGVAITKTTLAATQYLALNWTATGSTDAFTVDLSTAQLEAGSTATSYEPYVGGIPSPNPDYPQDVHVVTGTQTVNEVGKNWLDRANSSENYILTWANGDLYANTSSLTSPFIAVKSGQTFSANYNYAVHFYDSSYSYLGHLASDGQTLTKQAAASYFSDSITVPSGYGIKYMRVVYAKDVTVGQKTNPSSMLNVDIMLNIGTTVASYEPYHGGTCSVRLGSLELCKIGSYQDYIYTDGTSWWKHKAIANAHVKDKTSWTINNNCFQTTAFTDKDSSGVCLCSHFTFNSRQSQITSYLQNGEFGFNTTNTPTFKYTTITTTTAWNQWLTDNDPILYYILETAQDELIVDADLVSDLDALLAAKLATGQNTIMNSAVSPNLPAILSVETFENNWNGLSEALLEA